MPTVDSFLRTSHRQQLSWALHCRIQDRFCQQYRSIAREYSSRGAYSDFLLPQGRLFMSDIIASLKVNVRRYYYLQTTSNYEKSGSTYSPKRRFWLFTFEATSNEGQLSAYLWIVPVYTSLLRLESFSSKQCYIWTTPSGLQRRLNALDLICSLPIIRH
jgi:hypothetical protein